MSLWEKFVDAISNINLPDVISILKNLTIYQDNRIQIQNLVINPAQTPDITTENVIDAKERPELLSDADFEKIKKEAIASLEKYQELLERYLQGVDESEFPTMVNTFVVGSTLSSWDGIREQGEDFTPTPMNPEIFFKHSTQIRCKSKTCNQLFTSETIARGGTVEVGGATYRCPRCGHENFYQPNELQL